MLGNISPDSYISTQWALCCNFVSVTDTQVQDSWSGMIGERVQLRRVGAFPQLLLNWFFKHRNIFW